MSQATIYWCGELTKLLRVVLDPNLPEADRIRELAEGLRVPVVNGQTDLRAGDLWVGISPDEGWGDLAGDAMWARSVEAPIVIFRLEQAT